MVQGYLSILIVITYAWAGLEVAPCWVTFNSYCYYSFTHGGKGKQGTSRVTGAFNSYCYY